MKTTQYVSYRELYYLLFQNSKIEVEALPDKLQIFAQNFPTLEINNPEDMLDFLFEYRLQEEKPKSTIDRNEALLRFAPTAMVCGSVLESCVKLELSWTSLGQTLLSCFYECNGRGEAGKHPANLYRNFLGSLGLSLPPTKSQKFLEYNLFHESDFEYAAIFLQIGKSGISCLPETIGFQLAGLILGFPNIVNKFLPKEIVSNIDNTLIAKKLIVELKKSSATNWRKIWIGILLFLAAEKCWLESLTMPKQVSAWDSMITLIKSKSVYSFGFHTEVSLDRKNLDEWMDPAVFEPYKFLEKFANSKWISPGKPAKSSFFTRTIQFGGPMFGVFTKEEVETIRNWITVLDKEPLPPPPSPSVQKNKLEINIFNLSKDHNPKSLDLREIFYEIVNPSHPYSSSQNGYFFVKRILQKSQKKISNRFLKKENLSHYSSKIIKDWVDSKIQEQVLGKKNKNTNKIVKLIDYKDAIWILLQFTPAAFVDGGWLQGLFTSSHIHKDYANLLLTIYRDELGSGKIKQHHGYIMQKTFETENIFFPNFKTKDFIYSNKFVKEAFYMPTYWLSLAENSDEFLPELLGLNLAVEMAGIGQGYQTMIQILEYNNIDPYFFMLHNTIDNAASGHTAISVEAIQSYMDELQPIDIPSHWKRIWIGFGSYKIASAPLSFAIVKKIGLKLFGKWLKDFMKS